MLAPWKKSYDEPRKRIKKQRHHFPDKGPYSQSYGFSSSHVQICELDHKEDWAPKNWRFLTVVLEKTLESPLDCKGIKPINLKGNQSWVFIGRTDTKAEAPILWPLKSQWSSNPLAIEEPTHWKRFWCWERLRAGEGGNSGWDGLMGSSTQQTRVWARVWGYSKGQQSLACCSPWGRKETDTTK